MRVSSAMVVLFFCSSSMAAGHYKCDLLADDGSVVRDGRTFVDIDKALFTIGRGSVLDFILREDIVGLPDTPTVTFDRFTECKQTTTKRDRVTTHAFRCRIDVEEKSYGLDADLVFDAKSAAGAYRGQILVGSGEKFSVAFKNCRLTP